LESYFFIFAISSGRLNNNNNLKPKTKRKWIDNKNAETFRLVHRSQKDPLIADDTVGERVLQPIQKKNVEEHIKYGIYYDDDYNYLQHLRGVNEVVECEAVERTIIRAPKGKANLPSTLFETSGIELNVGLLNQQTLRADAIPDLDEDIIEALEGRIDDDMDELEDDFVLRANCGELPSNHPPEPIKATAFQNDQSDHDTISDGEIGSESNAQGLSVCFHSFTFREESGASGEDDAALSGHMASARIIDKKFERLYEEGESSDDEEEMEQNLLEPDSYRMKELVDECKNNKTDLVLENDEIAKRYAVVNEMNDESDNSEKFDKVSIERPCEKKARWDCETVLSSYSNIYNHPTVIQECTSKPKRRLKQRRNPSLSEVTNDPHTQQSSQLSEAMDCCESSEAPSSICKGAFAKEGLVLAASSSVLTTSRRPVDESADAKRERKRAVKEARAERRAEKKANKLAFAEEARRRSQASINSGGGGKKIKCVPIA
uniref:Protein LTV1 homolog n=1 Tax=Anisakis simplex TaxID=6269 RepID=A0A0M3JSX4_ANISI